MYAKICSLVLALNIDAIRMRGEVVDFIRFGMEYTCTVVKMNEMSLLFVTDYRRNSTGDNLAFSLRFACEATLLKV